MAKNKKNVTEEEEAPGAPEWMVTFSDCMTLLLTFFVLLLSFSSFDNKVFLKPRNAFIMALSSLNTTNKKEKESTIKPEEIEYAPEFKKAAEKATPYNHTKDAGLKHTDAVNFEKHRIFILPSSKIFLGRGSVLSPAGKNELDEFAYIIKRLPNRVMISEGTSEPDSLALARVNIVIKYLLSKGIKKNKIAAAPKHLLPGNTNTSSQRKLEITFFERGLFD